MSKTISVAVDDELHMQFQHALALIARQMGVDKVSSSVVLRDLIAKLVESPRPPFDAGFMEGYRAGYASMQRALQEALHKMVTDPTQIEGFGIGMSSPGDERGG